MTTPSAPSTRVAHRWLLVVALAVTVLVTACGGGGDAGPTVTGEAKTGQDLWRSKGCVNCHTINGNRSEGPSWKGLYGSTVTLKDGTTVTADDAYITQSIKDPNSQVVQGFSPLMPKTQMSDDEIKAVIAFIRALA